MKVDPRLTMLNINIQRPEYESDAHQHFKRMFVSKTDNN